MLSLDATIIYRVPALLMALTVHEYAHGAVSAQLGDPTPEQYGRLTMNPLAHLDPIGTLMLLLVGFGWAKPVVVDPRYYKNPRRDMMKVAFAGPGANLLLCFIAVVLMYVYAMFLWPKGMSIYLFLEWLARYNVWFAFFNLIPIPPLDGYNVLRHFLPADKAYSYENLIGRYANLILIVLCFTGIIGMIITPLASLYLGLCNTICYAVVGLFLPSFRHLFH
jgi:Zn-dependent protease